MAKGKNPKRVAAGKKAWRSRGKGKKRSGGGGGRGRGGKKPIQRGITGRIGAFVLGVMPPAIAGIDAVQSTMGAKKSWNLSGFGALQYGVIRWLNNMSNGFLGKPAFGEAMELAKEDGSVQKSVVNPGLPAGSLWAVAGTGILLMVYDAIAAKLAGGRPVKIPFTNYNATGGS